MTDKPNLKIVGSGLPDHDGRRARSERNREKIVDALFLLIQDGDMDPSAARVADAAGVGLRTVFRHFEEMDALYQEMSTRLETEILPVVMTPWKAQDPQGRLKELIARRASIYERIMPLKIAANLRRFQSEHLMHGYRRFLTMERSGLLGILSDDIKADSELVSALEMVIGFQAWRRLRQDLEISAENAEAIIARTALALLADRA